MLKLADKIYDPKKRTFIRLCYGLLQNGPDPTNGVRTMHCGLGELYFAMTGRHPETDYVLERDVTKMAVTLSQCKSEEFEEIIGSIADINDHHVGTGGINRYEAYRSRSCRVAAALRKAAEYLD
jgi:hypothetical protein